MAWGLIKETIKRLSVLALRSFCLLWTWRSYPPCWLASSADLQWCSAPLSVVEVLCLPTCTVAHDCLFLWLYPLERQGTGQKGVKWATFCYTLSFSPTIERLVCIWGLQITSQSSGWCLQSVCFDQSAVQNPKIFSSQQCKTDKQWIFTSGAEDSKVSAPLDEWLQWLIDDELLFCLEKQAVVPPQTLGNVLLRTGSAAKM